MKKVVTINKPHQDNVTVAILGCGDKDPVTVKTAKRGRVEVFQPLPVEKNKKPFVFLIAAFLLIIAGGVGWYMILKKKPGNSSTILVPPILNQSSSSKILPVSPQPLDIKPDTTARPKVQEPQKPPEPQKVAEEKKEPEKKTAPDKPIIAIPKKVYGPI